MAPSNAYSTAEPNYWRRAPAPQRKKSVGGTLARFMIFLVLGLMLGGAIGWILFPIELQAILPNATETNQTRQLVLAVADKYWRNLDAVQAQKELTGYDPEELAVIVGVILQETKSRDTRAHVAALAQALDLDMPDSSGVAILGQPLMWLAVLAALVPIALGVWLVLLPAWRERKAEQERLAEAEDGVGAQVGGEPQGATAAVANGGVAAIIGEDGVPVAMNGAAPASTEAIFGTPGAAAAEAQPQGGAPLPPLQAEVKEEGEEEAEEKGKEQNNILKDIANLFEEEDLALSALEGLVRNLPEISIDTVRDHARDISIQLRGALVERLRARM